MVRWFVVSVEFAAVAICAVSPSCPVEFEVVHVVVESCLLEP